MQIVFNTEDSLEDLKNINELVVNAIKKKGGDVKVEQVQQLQAPQVSIQQAQPSSFTQNPEPPTVSRLANSPFASMLRSEQSTSLGSPVHSVSKPVQQTNPYCRTGEIARINEEYKRQYEESRMNPSKPKGQNPEIDMSNIFMSDAGKREGRRFR